MLRKISYEDYIEQNREMLGHWVGRIYPVFYDANRLWLNERWIEARLNNNEHIAIYEALIREARNEINNRRNDEENTKEATAILKKYQKELFEELSQHMRDYCLDD